MTELKKIMNENVKLLFDREDKLNGNYYYYN